MPDAGAAQLCAAPRRSPRLLADAVLGALPALRLLRSAGRGGVYVNTLTLPSWPLLARLAGRRSVCHVHEAEQSAPRLLRIGMAVCPALADRVVTNSQFCLDVLAGTAPWLRRRATVIYNAVAAPAEVRPLRGTPEGPVRLLYVGRLSPRKGPQVAVATLQELLARGVDARLQLLGSVFEGYEWFETELRSTVAAAGLTDRVEFLGFRSDVWPVLADSDVVLVPSVLEESFGLTAVEAVIAARPLVASDGSGLREAAAGYASAQSVAPGDPGRWADAVQRVLADWAGHRAAAVDDATEARRRHAPQRYTEQLVAVLDTLAGGQSTAAVPAPRRPAEVAAAVAGAAR